jgi:hypothetical protein
VSARSAAPSKQALTGQLWSVPIDDGARPAVGLVVAATAEPRRCPSRTVTAARQGPRPRSR